MQAFHCLGQIFSAKGDDETALSLFNVALDGFTFMDVHHWQADCMVQIADILQARGMVIKAIELWKTARPLFERSFQMKDVIKIDAKIAEVDSAILAKYEEQLQHLSELHVPVSALEEAYITEEEEEEEEENKLTFQVLNEKRPPRPSSLGPPDGTQAISDQLWGTVEACWAHEPSDRPDMDRVVSELINPNNTAAASGDRDRGPLSQFFIALPDNEPANDRGFSSEARSRDDTADEMRGLHNIGAASSDRGRGGQSKLFRELPDDEFPRPSTLPLDRAQSKLFGAPPDNEFPRPPSPPPDRLRSQKCLTVPTRPGASRPSGSEMGDAATANDSTAGSSSESSSDTGLDISSNETDCAGEFGSFVIYSYNDIKPERASFTGNDLTAIQTSLSTRNISCLMSVHEPGDAVSWIEENWNSDLLDSIRNSDCGGPLPWMLSPEESSLAIFGSYQNSTVVGKAQALAEFSGFPVVIRPPGDNPVLTLINDAELRSASDDGTSSSTHKEKSSDGNDAANKDEDMPERVGNSGGGAGRESAGHGDEGAGEQRQRGRAGGSGGGGDENNGKNGRAGGSGGGEDKGQNRNAGGSGGGGGGGGGDDGEGPTFVDDKWESPLHGTRAKLGLKINTAQTYTVNIGYTFRFTIQRKTEIPINLNDLNGPLSQPEVISLVDFKIETRPRETQVDRSYASIGFVAHRKKSIFQREFLHRGFDLPDKLYMHGKNRQIQREVRAALGFSQGGPLATTAFAYHHNSESTLEATDSKVMPRCHVAEEIGDEWDSDNESYSSYNMVYRAHVKPLEGDSEFYPLAVKVGMGINLQPSGSKAPHPRISFVNRNQVFIWVFDPTSKARIRGIVVLMSSYLANIRSQEELAIYEQADIDLSAGPSNAPTENDHHEPGTISLSIAKVENQNTPRPNRLRMAVSGLAAKLKHRCPTSDVTYIRPHEYLARGWDATNSRWRSVLWPALNKDFGAADLEGTPPVWVVQCPWTKGIGTSSSADP
ncbi:hypothetical protein C8J57DRAFT_1735729 [Mycena rebaudengoi]|nr:hypothetical protein C8J57DRAFT_1735729 [Mycena rebaudengoi]